jgi:tRNA (cytidine32/uridine32-2'-O)-methyltransferase
LSKFSNIVVVLVETSHPGNIGAAARSMKTMGLERLRLVAPHQFPSAQASERAAGADDILHTAEVVPSLAQALADTCWAVGTSARPRHLDWPELSPSQCAQAALGHAVKGSVAIVFGRERSGLTNDELQLCQALVRIPTAPNFSSLNVASAVQILAYELRCAGVGSESSAALHPAPLATPAELEGLYAHLEKTMTDIGFYDPDKPKLLMRRLRRLYARAGLEQSELNILRGILRATDERLKSR